MVSSAFFAGFNPRESGVEVGNCTFFFVEFLCAPWSEGRGQPCEWLRLSSRNVGRAICVFEILRVLLYTEANPKVVCCESLLPIP